MASTEGVRPIIRKLSCKSGAVYSPPPPLKRGHDFQRNQNVEDRKKENLKKMIPSDDNCVLQMRPVEALLDSADVDAVLLREMAAEDGRAFTREIPRPVRPILSADPAFAPLVLGWSLDEEPHGKGQLAGLRVGREVACQSLII